jgi:hypothetical protein
MPNDKHDNNDSLNPFAPSQPAQPEYFADRRNELTNFRRAAINSARLKIPAPENFAILGTWGEGKTSLLYKFRQMAIEELQKEISCACIYFPLSAQSARTWETFTSDFLRNIKSTISSSKSIVSKFRKEVARWEPSVSLGPIGATRKAPTESSLTDSLQTLWEKHLAPSGTQIVFILIDDLHHFPIQRKESAYLTLRTTFQELVNRRCNYSLAVTAPKLLFSEITEVAEPLGRFFEQFVLQPFNLEDAVEAVDVRLKAVGSKLAVSDEVVETIVQKTVGHPFLLMFVMRELLNQSNGERAITKSGFEKAWPRIEKSLGDAIFYGKFQRASSTERKLLIAIAETGSEEVAPIEFKQFSGVTKMFSRLEEKELLIRHERGKYSLFHPLFAEYLKRQ